MLLSRAHKRERKRHIGAITTYSLNMPQIPGWEFAANWQPAREVSGDFYDFIRNKDRLEIVIADVSSRRRKIGAVMSVQ